MNKILYLGLFGLALSACSNNDDPAPPPPPQQSFSEQVGAIAASAPEAAEPLDVATLVESTSETDEPLPVTVP